MAESLSSFVEKHEPKSCEFDKILARDVLVAPSSEQYTLLTKRLRQQLGEGRGEVIIEVTVTFDFLAQFSILVILTLSNSFLTSRGRF